MVRCIMLCQRYNNCYSINYREVGGHCQLLNHTTKRFKDGLTDDENWTHCENTFGKVCQEQSSCPLHLCEDICEPPGFKRHCPSANYAGDRCNIDSVEPLASNVARNKTATAYITYPSTPPSMAVDGDLRNYFYTSCFSNYPYVQVDLGKDYLITKIYVYMGCCINKKLEMVLTIGGADDNTKKQCGIVNEKMKKTVSDLEYFPVICEEAQVGRYVKAEIRKNHSCISTNELEVYGYEL